MRSSRKTVPSTSILALTAMAAFAPAPAFAQEARGADGFDIVVTARNREETLIQAPLSVTAMTAEEIEARQIEGLDDLATFTPGLAFQQASSTTSSRPMIRGMSQLARSSGDVSNVGIFVDGVYSPGLSGTDLPFVAVERVEVVRGPQAAQYGRNTFSGAINYITKRPGDDFAAGLRSELGQYGAYNVFGYLSTPLIPEQLAIRIDAGVGSTGGKFRNSVNGDRLNDRDSELFRLGMQINPTERLSMFVSGTYFNDEANHSPLLVIPDDSPRRVGKPAPTSRSPVQIGRRVAGRIDDYTESFSYDARAFGSKRRSVRLAMVADYDFDGVSLVSRTGYENRQVRTLSDLDQTPDGTLFSRTGPYTQTASGDIEDRWEFSQDLRLQSSNPGRLDWTVGLYYSNERNVQSDVRFADPALGTGGLTAPAPIDGRPLIDQQDLIKNQFKSVYGVLGYNFDFGLKLTAEGRYTSETKKVRTLQNNYGSDRTLPLGDQMKETFNYFTPRFIISYEPTRSLNFYVSAAKGTKSGGFNPTATLDEEKIYKPEINWAYELGVKGSVLNGAVQFAAAAFHVDWTNQQLLTFATGPVSGSDTSITTNISKSKVDGAELQLQVFPVKGITLSGSYAYTNARFDDAETSSFANFVDCENLPKLECVNGVTTGRIDGNQLAFSAKHQLTLGAELLTPLSDALDFFARVDYSLASKRYVDNGNVGYIPATHEVRARIGIQNDRFKAQAYCENITNDKTPVTAFESRDFNGTPHYYVRIREPRRCGLTFGVDF